MTVSWLYLVGALIGAWFTKSALWPARLPWGIPSFFAGWLTNELVLHHYVWQAVAAGLFVANGALEHWPGWVALGLTLLQWIGNAYILRNVLRARPLVEEVLREGLPEEPPPRERDRAARRLRLRWLVAPIARHPAVTSEWHRPWARVGGKELRLDIHRPKDPEPNAPVLVYVHGGGWVIGFRERQGLPLMFELATMGWVCVSIDYRLSPAATFPDHLIDVKRGIAWVREHADELGIDPTKLVIAGNSAGGHLSALAALTPGRPELQPGFEDADTSVGACLPFYGIYDFLDRDAGFGFDDWMRFLQEYVLKAFVDERPDLFELASPIDQINPDAPPFLVVHGSKDSLAPTSSAREFVRQLREVSANPVLYLELPGTQHAFDVFPSIRSIAVIDGCVRFLEQVRTRWRNVRDAEASDDEQADTEERDTEERDTEERFDAARESRGRR